MTFIDEKIFFWYVIRYIQIDQRFPMQQSELKISDSVESYDGKTDEITTL